MKIKTIEARLIDAEDFDKKVNEALAEGYQIARQDIIPGNSYMSNMLYAQMILPDPVAEPEQVDPVEALRTIRDHCAAVPTEKCLSPDCPLSPWCYIYSKDGESPADWPIPGEEVGL